MESFHSGDYSSVIPQSYSYILKHPYVSQVFLIRQLFLEIFEYASPEGPMKGFTFFITCLLTLTIRWDHSSKTPL